MGSIGQSKLALSGKSGSASPDFEVTIGGRPLSTEVLAHVSGLTVDLSLDKAGMFTMEMSGIGEGQDEESLIDDDELFAIGQPVELKVGYGKDLQFLFGGEIAGLDPTFSSERPPAMTVRSYDRSLCLNRGTQNRTFTKLRYSDIAAQIAGEASLTPQVQDSSVEHEFIYQANQSNLEFLRALAKEIDYEVMVEDRSLIFRPVANGGHAVMTLTMEKELVEFSARLSATRQVTEVVVNGWSPKEKKGIVGRAKAGDVAPMNGGKSAASLGQKACGAAVEIVSWHPLMSQAEADQIAKARFGEISLKLVEGSGSTEGRADLRPGRVIKIAGVGERFSGPYYVTETTHRFDQQNGYRTNFSIRRNDL
ncbi:MAG TPA: contractile injection system protein, VgrG/Pvc8 family [Pyrinomonadaceae bacterium]